MAATVHRHRFQDRLLLMPVAVVVDLDQAVPQAQAGRVVAAQVVAEPTEHQDQQIQAGAGAVRVDRHQDRLMAAQGVQALSSFGIPTQTPILLQLVVV